MKRIQLGYGRQQRELRVEFEGGSVDIDVCRFDASGNRAVRVYVNANGTRYAGEKPWFINGDAPETERSVTIIEVPK